MHYARNCVFTSICCMIAIFGHAFADARPTSIGPAGNAFYQPPSPLPEGGAGTVIWMRPLDGTMAMPSAARNTLILYKSLDPLDNPVVVSGTISIPKGQAPEEGWPVITWTHGTTGLAAICGPSRDTLNGPEHPYIKETQTLLDGFVASGYAIVATDYQGLGVPGFHPFLQGIPNGRNAIDIVRAARSLEPSIGTRYAVMGHSQGGHADLFTAAQAPEYAPELTLVSNTAFAPGTNIAVRLRSIINSDKVEIGLPYMLYILQSYAKYNSDIDLKRILTPQAIANLPELQVGCMTHALTTGYWSTAVARDQFLPDPDLSSLLKVIAQNEPSSLKISVPTMILQGGDDVTVRPADTDASVQKLCASDNTVDYRVYPDADHNGSMKAGAAEAKTWIEARFNGNAATGNCSSLPKAQK